MKRALLWDFDGVICHSLDECLMTSYNAFQKFNKGQSRFIKSLSDVPEDVREFFYDKRQYVRRPGEYLILYVGLGAGRRLDDYSAFKCLLSKHVQEIQGYEEAFFEAREALRKNGMSEWLGLHHGYPWVNEKWERLKKTFAFYIISNKDRQSISLILKHLGLGIAEKNIFGKEFSMQKTTIIEHILSKRGIFRERVYMIDDHFAHLMDVAHLGIRLFFATWGYGKPEASGGTGVVFLEKDIFDCQLLGGIHE